MSFTINLFSTQGTQDAGNNNSMTYNIDWDAMPQHDGEYEVTFTFISATISTATTSHFFPTVNWGAIPNAYAPTSTTGATTSQPTLALGFVRPSVIGASGQYFADINSNVPVVITRRPSQNQFRMRLLTNTGGLAAFAGVAYVMVIRFTAI